MTAPGMQRWDEPLHIAAVKSMNEAKAQIRQTVMTMLGTVETETEKYQGRAARAFNSANSEINEVSRAVDTYFGQLDTTMASAKSQLLSGIDSGAQQHNNISSNYVSANQSAVRGLPGLS
jgi:uncharacterized protein YukE